MKRGLLLTMTEPSPAMEEEFNAWYDTEHLPEPWTRRCLGKAAVPGAALVRVYRAHAP